MCIPNAKKSVTIVKPFVGKFPITQLWGKHPGWYNKFSYGGVPLKGHNGIDFGTPVGTKIVATDSGRVSSVGFDKGGFGNYIWITHSWGSSIYAHLSSISVSSGEVVEHGDVIGLSGNTGNSTGPHLHFSVRVNPFVTTDGWGGFSDPLPMIDPSEFA